MNRQEASPYFQLRVVPSSPVPPNKDGARFHFTLGSHESDLWVLDLKRR